MKNSKQYIFLIFFIIIVIKLAKYYAEEISDYEQSYIKNCSYHPPAPTF